MPCSRGRRRRLGERGKTSGHVGEGENGLTVCQAVQEGMERCVPASAGQEAAPGGPGGEERLEFVRAGLHAIPVYRALLEGLACSVPASAGQEVAPGGKGKR